MRKEKKVKYMKKKKPKRSKRIICPYCGAPAELRPGTYLLKNRSREEWFYVCSRYPKCDSYVGVIQGTLEPKGTMADAHLRNKRIEAHRVFDAIWKGGLMTRKNAYRWLRETLGLPDCQTHIGYFSTYLCDVVIRLSIQVLKNHEGRK